MAFVLGIGNCINMFEVHKSMMVGDLEGNVCEPEDSVVWSGVIMIETRMRYY